MRNDADRPLSRCSSAQRRPWVTEWTDVVTPDTRRTFSGPRREVNDNYVEARGLQNPDGGLEELGVRAHLDVWECHNP